ncbi:MAG: NTP transferase domain-containing protein [Lentisphaerae bacterium]|nr:NTP transferase domain-containing protein [Lentisphaerota bacterium]
MEQNAYAVILAGGKGERFWPLSTSRTPKQVLSLFGGRTLLAMAVDRLKGLLAPDHVFVITSAELVAVTREAAPILPPQNIVGEPVGRDTAAACALAMALVQARDPQGVLAIVTADHIMGDLEVFQNTLRQSFALARREDVLITIGITPTFPSTGYGYVDAGDVFATESGITFCRARKFVEKPNLATAEQYLAAGNYYWNAGMFIWSVDAFSRALATHRPVLHTMAGRLAPLVGKPEFPAALATEYGKLDKISVDYAIMEPSRNILMARGTFAWDDVGSWPSLANHFPADASGNVSIGQCETVDAAGNVVISQGRLTALLGVRDLVVVQAEGATLICPKERAQDVKKIVSLLAGKPEYRHLL